MERNQLGDRDVYRWPNWSHWRCRRHWGNRHSRRYWCLWSNGCGGRYRSYWRRHYRSHWRCRCDWRYGCRRRDWGNRRSRRSRRDWRYGHPRRHRGLWSYGCCRGDWRYRSGILRHIDHVISDRHRLQSFHDPSQLGLRGRTIRSGSKYRNTHQLDGGSGDRIHGHYAHRERNPDEWVWNSCELEHFCGRHSRCDRCLGCNGCCRRYWRYRRSRCDRCLWRDWGSRCGRCLWRNRSPRRHRCLWRDGSSRCDRGNRSKLCGHLCHNQYDWHRVENFYDSGQFGVRIWGVPSGI